MNVINVSNEKIKKNLLSFEFGDRVIKVGDLWKFKRNNGKPEFFLILKINFKDAYLYTTKQNTIIKLPIVIALNFKNKKFHEISILENPSKWTLLNK